MVSSDTYVFFTLDAANARCFGAVIVAVDGVIDGIDEPNKAEDSGSGVIVGNGFIDDLNGVRGFGGESMVVDRSVDVCGGKMVTGGVFGIDIGDNMG